MLDKLGFHAYKMVRVNIERYLIYYEFNEEYMDKTKLLVTKLKDSKTRFVDITTSTLFCMLKYNYCVFNCFYFVC